MPLFQPYSVSAGVKSSLAVNRTDGLFSLARLRVIYFVEEGKGAEAEPLYRQAVRVWEKAAGPDYPYATRLLLRTAEICRSQARSAEARSFYQQIISIYDKHRVIRDRTLPKVLENYAALLRHEGRSAEVSEVERRAKGLNPRQQNPPN